MKTPRKPAQCKTPSLRTLRRRFLAVQQPTVGKPLTDAEYLELGNLITQASESNIRMFDVSRHVSELRLRLESAEGELKSAREKNTKIHSVMTPLFHRLPS